MLPGLNNEKQHPPVGAKACFGESIYLLPANVQAEHIF